jgi:uncharacterized protein YndB with AHSA1/START domain
MSATAGDRARATVAIAVAPAEAFRIFTEEIDLWWRRGRRFRNAPGQAGLIAIEPRVGGRLFESFDIDGGEQAVEVGRVSVWDPPHRLVFDWRNSNFAPNEHTEVDVRFERAGSGTRVTVEHRGWSTIRPDHPARHGKPVPEFLRMIGLWWGDLLTALRLHAAARSEDPAPE